MLCEHSIDMPPCFVKDPQFCGSLHGCQIVTLGLCMWFSSFIRENKHGAWQTPAEYVGALNRLPGGCAVLASKPSRQVETCFSCSARVFLRGFCLLPLLILFFFFPFL